MANPQDEYIPRASGYPWLKFKTGILDNPDYFRMSDTARAVYFEIYLLAGKSDADGGVLAGEKPATIADIADILRRDWGTVEDALGELANMGWVKLDDWGVTITRFSKEQGPAAAEKRKAWAEWQREHRKAAKENPETAPDPGENSKIEPVKDLKEQETDQERKDLKDSQITPSNTVINDSERDEYLGFSEAEVLAIWNEKKGRNDPKPAKLAAMVQAWNAAGVSLETIAQAIDQFDSADTLQYFENIATWSRNGAKKTKPNAAIPPQGKNDNLDAWRKLSDKYKNGGWK